ncbi:MAG: TetR/AcrR family transcriptional regulator [Pseudorhizobium sp.]|jgi:AcrR family transcriptional regulator
MNTRTKNAAATRAALLVAARRRFLNRSYSDVGLRDVAGDAGVDVAMVARYFGSKEELFREVIRGSQPDWLDPELKAEALPALLAKMVVHGGGPEERENFDRLIIMLRSSSSPVTAGLVRTAFEEDVLNPLAALLAGDDAHVRASLALAVLSGFKVLRTVMTVQPLHECQQLDLEGRIRDLLHRALFG